MILVNLKGGLGNQMFQYACGRAMSLRSQTGSEINPLKLDTSGFAKIANSDTPRNFRLDMFNINADIASDSEIRAIKYPFGPISKAIRLFRAKILRQFNVAFDPRILSLVKSPKQNIYLDGFFQSEEYFKDFADEIRADFTLKQSLGPVAQSFFEKISRDPYGVSIHVRRSDYVTDAKTNAAHGTCDVEYYKRAVAEITKSIPKPNIYVFSDDIEWAKENLPGSIYMPAISFPITFVSAPDIADFEEMYLMSLCRHNIIANSSFSWWSAWLNNNPDKIVIAPTRWANKYQNLYKDIVPNTWKRI